MADPYVMVITPATYREMMVAHVAHCVRRFGRPQRHRRLRERLRARKGWMIFSG